MRAVMRAFLTKVPGLHRALELIRRHLTWRRFRGSAAYWQLRYGAGGTSGAGSYGALAQFKAAVLNEFVAARQVASVIELGCGDGNQLRYSAYPRYIGLDVARSAIAICRDKFRDDPTKRFFFFDPECFVDSAGLFRADLALSLDVLFHLVEDSVFARYLELLFQVATRFVIIYSSNHDEVMASAHERQREFTSYVAAHFPEWRLADKIKNRYPITEYPEPLGSLADFYIYERRDAAGCSR